MTRKMVSIWATSGVGLFTRNLTRSSYNPLVVEASSVCVQQVRFQVLAFIDFPLILSLMVQNVLCTFVDAIVAILTNLQCQNRLSALELLLCFPRYSTTASSIVVFFTHCN